MLTRRSALQSLAAAPWLAPQPAARKPNLLVILADDMGYADIGCYGSPDVPTPNIDALARGGTRFTDGYVSCAVCSPSRVALLTGRYQHRFGHEFNSGPPQREAEVNFGLPADARILPQYLKPHGYRSAAIGKWHLGIRPGYHPLDRGFDEFYGFLTGGNAFVTKRTPGARAVGAEGAPPNIPERRSEPIFRNRETVIETATSPTLLATRPYASSTAITPIRFSSTSLSTRSTRLSTPPIVTSTASPAPSWRNCAREGSTKTHWCSSSAIMAARL